MIYAAKVQIFLISIKKDVKNFIIISDFTSIKIILYFFALVFC
ncbi:hypothetical protein SAMN04488130_101313 [Flavobacterium urumqiense]|uniref:Uncharacterized protein n=1 Tax=Flavobacterium urumqiense TaxID=935224 RepID=A0A1H5SIV6_9FLAO|nr:hypothetical protein SAMN04488130_101313 [Flavobacterium urumqiense]